MYTTENFKSKAALKRALAEGQAITVTDNSLFSNGEPVNGTVYLEGPHFPAPHTWYAQATVKNNVILMVK